MHTLVTLLGKVNDPKYPHYREATYDFGDGETYTSRFFGLTLQKALKPDHLVVLGTSGSMWDNLMREAGLDDEAVKSLAALGQQSAISEVYLQEFVPALEQHLGIPCSLKIIPYGRDQDEQTQILHILMQHFNEGDSASLDVTHGFRHLPMLMQQSALLLQSLKNVKINGIFYGALEMTSEDLTPVMQLTGLLEVERWTKAFHRYEQDGDYAAFEEPLKASDVNATALSALKNAAYYERTFNLTEAGKQLAIVNQSLPEQLDGVGGFFTQQFKEHISWSENTSLAERQAKLAHFYLDNREFVRAAIFAVESVISSLVDDKDFATQHLFGTRRQYETRLLQQESLHKENYKYLKGIRNALAHGTPPDESSEKRPLDKAIARKSLEVMESPELLDSYLRDLFKKLGIKP